MSVPENFMQRFAEIIEAGPDALILREKDLNFVEYLKLARQVADLNSHNRSRLILHNYPQAAAAIGCKAIHLPLPVLREIPACERQKFDVLGSSCHSVEEALEAEAAGCTYISAGHIFATDCKKGLPGRGIEFLHEICSQIKIPVYAIGGIKRENIAAVAASGAAGACIMSGFMQAENSREYLNSLRKALD